MSGEVGFIGLGLMGEGMVRNLLKNGVRVTVWNRTDAKAKALHGEYPDLVTVAAAPKDVVATAALTFSILSNVEASEAVLPSVLEGVTAGHAVVDCATLTPEAMQKASKLVKEKGGRFLEAPVSGSKKPAADGTLIFLAAGDKDVFDECEKYFAMMGKAHHFYGDVGQGTNMKLAVNMTMGSMMAAIGEGIGFAEKTGLKCDDFMEVINNGAMACPMYKLKAGNFNARNHPPAFPLEHAHKDMRFALGVGQTTGALLPVAQAAEATFAASSEHYGKDFSALTEAHRK
eukprot:TRINITY_DN14971_c0_g2_i1.p2 TRINITY_DN14971_c0_g2~~TRINITY_DN14971_c0_g2_i1.p2  ORF type:complete len:287 (+),score=128.31 TRINITY_DN14971_c0_g2_i1:59-919(+)